MSVKCRNEEYNAVMKKDLLTLDLSGKKIKDISEIEGLDTLTDLQVLNLSDNQIVEIKGLEYLINLIELDLSNNYIKEIKGLNHLIRLKKLNLKNNRFYSIKGFENLINLERLNLGLKHASVGLSGKELTKAEKFTKTTHIITPFGLLPKKKTHHKGIVLNGKELVGVEMKVATRSPKNVVAYCRVGLKKTGNIQYLVPASREMEKLEAKIEKELEKYDRMLKRAERERIRQTQRQQKYSQTRLY
jgi:hypothetical protein